jgi:chemotaxis protein histidine kinase CheA
MSEVMATTNPLEDFWASFEQNQEEPVPAIEETAAEEKPIEKPTEEKQAEEIIPENTTETTEETNEEASAETTAAEEPPAKPKRHRRTKAEMEAARKAEAEAKAEETESTNESTDTVEETTDNTADTVEEVVEEKSTKKTKTSTKTSVPTQITVTINNNQTYKDIIGALDLLPAVDEDFIKVKQDIQDKMNQIVVQSGMDKANIEVMGQKIDELNAIISARFAAMKTAYENLSSRDDGILMRVIAKGSMSGAPYSQGNDAARRANGINAAENFISPKTQEKVDLFWGVYATRYAKNFYEAAAEQLENKRRLLKQQADLIIN